MPPTEDEYVFFDAGVFIGALLIGDSRHAEARPLVGATMRGTCWLARPRAYLVKYTPQQQ
jgi:hypothetical protein